MHRKKGEGFPGAEIVSPFMMKMDELAALPSKAKRLEADLEEKTYQLKKLEDAQKGDKRAFKTMETKIAGIEQELDDISQFMTGNKYHKTKEKKMKKAATAALATVQKQKKKAAKVSKKGELWRSPNTIATVMQLQSRSFDGIPKEEIEEIKMVWCLVFDMPEKSHAKANTSVRACLCCATAVVACVPVFVLYAFCACVLIALFSVPVPVDRLVIVSPSSGWRRRGAKPFLL